MATPRARTLLAGALLSLSAGALLASASASAAAPPRKNVLFVTIDDLRPQLNAAYGMAETLTPNLDSFADGALVFHRAYCQQAVCSPSRNSFMSGRRPDTTKVWNFVNHFRQPGVGSSWKSMPQWFKEHGYLTLGAGKHFHPNKPPGDDFPTSWSEIQGTNPYYWGNQAPIGDADPCNAGKRGGASNLTFPLRAEYGNALSCTNSDPRALDDADAKDQPQADSRVEYAHRLATRTIEHLKYAKASAGKNFFVGVGIRKPHLPWRVPTRFWDMYDGRTITNAKHQTIGDNITELAFERNGGPGYSGTYKNKSYGESPNGELGALPQGLQQGLRRGYYAAISFMDFEVGRILDAVAALGLHDNTAVLFHADHGWKLGEHGDWSKCSNWELDARVPLIIRAPWIKASVGQRTWQFAELIDMFPTLVELAGLPLPPASEGLEGTSLVPVITNPKAQGAKVMAFSQYPRCPEHSMYTDPVAYECLQTHSGNISHMGFSVRVADFRYTEWRLWKRNCVGDWTTDGLVAQELYNHTGDQGHSAATFDDFEFVNLAYQPAQQPTVLRLRAVLVTQFAHQNATCPPSLASDGRPLAAALEEDMLH